MKTPPQSYAAWQQCIVVDCGIKLTPKYISERLVALQDDQDYHTMRFVELYGEQHRQRVIEWFNQASKVV